MHFRPEEMSDGRVGGESRFVLLTEVTERVLQGCDACCCGSLDEQVWVVFDGHEVPWLRRKSAVQKRGAHGCEGYSLFGGALRTRRNHGA